MSAPAAWQENLVENAARRLGFAAQALAAQSGVIAEAGSVLGQRLAQGKKVLVAGNGGSAACAQHFAAEFTGRLSVERAPLSAIALTTDTSALTAIANDWTYDEVFARQVRAHGKPGDVFVGLSTSGTSRSIKRAVEAAEELDLTTMVLTGSGHGLGGTYVFTAALRETARVQEVHTLILHELVQIAERVAFSDLGDDASADRFPFLLAPDDLRSFRDWVTESKQTLVTSNGVFDLLHEGHLSSLRQARAYGDQLVVLVNSDESVRRLKGPTRPILLETERVRTLQRSCLVDHVVLLTNDLPNDLLDLLRPDVHCKGEEYAARPMPERQVVERHGGRIELVAHEPGLSTSSTVARARGTSS